MSHPTLDADWKRWISDNLNRGCTISSMINAMVAKGWTAYRAEKAIRQKNDYVYTPEEWLDQPTVACRDGSNIKVLLSIKKPRILLMEEVFSPSECVEMIQRANSQLRPSTTVDPSTGEYKIIKDRRSMSAYFKNTDDYMNRINSRLSDIMHIPVENGEDLQVVKYTAGGEYKPHWDYFPHSDPGSAPSMTNGGQRMATLIVYLNTVTKGGATAFPKINFKTLPHQGNGLYFHYVDVNGQLDDQTLHAGEPVLEGEKWIVTKWMRVGKRT